LINKHFCSSLLLITKEVFSDNHWSKKNEEWLKKKNSKNLKNAFTVSQPSQWWRSGLDFTNMFKRSFYARRLQKRKLTDDFSGFFALLGYTCAKAECKMLVKLTPYVSTSCPRTRTHTHTRTHTRIHSFLSLGHFSTLVCSSKWYTRWKKWKKEGRKKGPSSSLSLSLLHTLSLSHSLSLSLTHTHTLSLSLSLSHTHTHTPSLILFLAFSLPFLSLSLLSFSILLSFSLFFLSLSDFHFPFFVSLTLSFSISLSFSLYSLSDFHFPFLSLSLSLSLSLLFVFCLLKLLATFQSIIVDSLDNILEYIYTYKTLEDPLYSSLSRTPLSLTHTHKHTHTRNVEDTKGEEKIPQLTLA